MTQRVSQGVVRFPIQIIREARHVSSFFFGPGPQASDEAFNAGSHLLALPKMPKSGKKRELMVERQKEPRVDTLWDHGIKDNTELLLESVLFGRDIPSTSREQAKDTVSDSGLDDVLDAEVCLNLPACTATNIQDQLFFVDDNVANEIAEETTVGPSIRLSGDSQATDIVRNQRKSAWKDESDVGLAVSLTAKKQRRKLRETIEEDEVDGRDYEHRLRNKYEQMNPTPRWAADARKNLHTRKRRRASVSSTEETPPALFTSTSDALERRTSLLPHGILSIERLRDANQTSRTQGGVHSVEFHPNVNVPVLSTAGSDRRLRLFNVRHVRQMRSTNSFISCSDRRAYQPTSSDGPCSFSSPYGCDISPIRFIHSPHGSPPILFHS